MFCLCAAFQKLFGGINNTATDEVISSDLSQIISVGVVHGEPVCRIAAAVSRRVVFESFLTVVVPKMTERGNINTAALVTVVECNTLVVLCSRQLIGPADWVFVILGPLRCD